MSANSAPATKSVEPSARVPIEMRRVPGVRRLAADYSTDFAALSPFFSGNPSDRRAWADAVARTQAHHRPHAEMAAVVGAQQRRRGAPPAAIDAATRLADSHTVAVVTGQQAGLFGGPLYTLLKALTAIRLAERTAREHDVPAVAVFWVEAEDHDWDEIRSCTVFDAELTPRSVSLPARTGTPPTPAAAVTLDASVEDALTELTRTLPETEFRADLIDQLRTVYQPGTGMADAFARWLERVLGPRGLVVYDASDPAAKPLARGVFTRELATAGQTTALASAAGAALAGLGYHAQVQPQADSVGLFDLSDGRRPIRRGGDQFLIGDDSIESAALLERAETRPTGFSPNVLLRPIVQDTLFPTVCYVAGPNELAYLGQLRGVYEHFSVPMPLMFPRATATLLDSAAVRFLGRYQVPLEALQPQDDSRLNDLLQAQIPGEVETSFGDARTTIDAALTRVSSALKTVDPTLEGAAQSTLGRMQHDLDTLHGKLIQAAKRRDDTLRRQFARTRALAFPGGDAQERAIGFISFLNQYGPALIERLDDELPLDLGHHWIVTI